MTIIRHYHVLMRSVAISKNFDAYTMLGGIYSDKNDKFYDPEKAELYYKWAINQNPNRSNFVKLRLSRLYADNESVLCDYEEALEVLNGASDTKRVSIFATGKYIQQFQLCRL